MLQFEIKCYEWYMYDYILSIYPTICKIMKEV